MTIGKTIYRLGALLIVGGIALFLSWAYQLSAEAQRYVVELGPEIRDKFGFDSNSPYVQAGDERREVFAVYPRDGGYLKSVGFRNEDIIRSKSIAGFYKMLYDSGNETITVTVVSGGDGPAIEDRVKRTLTFYVPD